MAITTNTELATAVANWLARDDLSSRIPEFIALAEAKFRRDIKTLDQETKNTTFSITGEYVAVPTDFYEVRTFQVTAGGNRQTLSYLSPELQVQRYVSTGVPRFYAVVGSNFQFAPVPDTTYTATLVYYISFTAWTAGTGHNWILDKHPDLYLYGALLESEAFLKDDERIPVWKAGYDQAMAGINGRNNRSRWGGPGLQIRPG